MHKIEKSHFPLVLYSVEYHLSFQYLLPPTSSLPTYNFTQVINFLKIAIFIGFIAMLTSSWLSYLYFNINIHHRALNIDQIYILIWLNSFNNMYLVSWNMTTDSRVETRSEKMWMYDDLSEAEIICELNTLLWSLIYNTYS